MKKATLILALLTVGFVGLNYAQVKMNEIYSRGGGTVYSGPDWIEIYNAGTAAVDISGYKIYDSGGNGGTKPKMTLASGITIPAKGFYVVVTDIATTTDPSGFGLSSGGEKVWLEDKTGAVIDTVTFAAMTENQTYSRVPNGSTWKLVPTMTRGLSNSIIVMNEIYSRGGGTVYAEPDWIELYNSSAAEVDLSGYKIYDSGGNGGTKPKMTLASGTKIPAKGYLAIVTDISTSVDPSGFGLSSGGEEVWLEDNTGAVIDNISFAAMTESQTFSRVPDGGNWGLVTGMTRGKTNGTGTSVKSKDEIATEYRLQQNYPNPFNPSTKIEYSIPQSGLVSLKVYDILGNEIAALVNQHQSAGNYIATFNATNLSTGIYFYKLQSGDFVKTNKMLLIK